MKKTYTNKKSVIMIVITMFLSTVTAWAENPSVKYISRVCDENNQVVEKSLSVSNYTVLDGTDASKEIYLEDDAWYVVKDYEVKYRKSSSIIPTATSSSPTMLSLRRRYVFPQTIRSLYTLRKGAWEGSSLMD